MHANVWRFVPRAFSATGKSMPLRKTSRPLLALGMYVAGWVIWTGSLPLCEQQTQAAETEPATPHALQTALGTNVDYCQEWLDGGDLKSLKQTAEGLLLLADLLEAQQGDNAWQQEVKRFRVATKDLIQSATADQAEECKQKLAALASVVKQLSSLPYPAKAAPLRNLQPSAGLKPMMVLLDGTHADAKRAVLFGEFDAARGSAEVLVELGPLLAAYRGDPKWNEHAAAFITAAKQAAQVEGENPKVYREALAEIYRRCEACHNRR